MHSWLKKEIKVLLVGDEDGDFISLMKKAMKEVKFKLEYARTFEKAQSGILENNYDLCLFDRQTYIEDEFRMLRTIREKGNITPIIFLMREAVEEIVDKVINAGATDCLDKSKLPPEFLSQALRYALALHEKEMLHRKTETALRKAYDELEMRVNEHTAELIESNKLLKSEISERAQAEQKLQKAHAETNQLLSSISSILIGVGPDDRITRWNSTAEEIFGVACQDLIGQPFPESGINWDWEEMKVQIAEARERDRPTRFDDIVFIRPDGKEGFLGLTLNPIITDKGKKAGYLLLASDIAERRNLESQLAQAQKLESIGQLAAGIAHEINTPIQYVGDNIRFLQDAFGDLSQLISQYNALLKAVEANEVSDKLIGQLKSMMKDADMEFLVDEIPMAIHQSLEGIGRVANIILAMKEFSHPGVKEKTITDINKALENTITVSTNEWKYVAQIMTNFDPNLPSIHCLPHELNQVFLNILVNAAHAIAGVVGEGTGKKGVISVSTKSDGEYVEVRIGDSGKGIPPEIKSRIFDPFFTTKEVGKGTGQGLAISHNVVVDKHGGTLTFETEEGKGTTFIIRLPISHS